MQYSEKVKLSFVVNHKILSHQHPTVSLIRIHFAYDDCHRFLLCTIKRGKEVFLKSLNIEHHLFLQSPLYVTLIISCFELILSIFFIRFV